MKMGMSEREKAIAVLQKERKTALHDNVWAFDYAISSLKTDLKYDLMYEGEEIYTKADIAERLEKFQKKIEELDLTDVFPDYQRGATDTRDYISMMLQKEIDSLKGENEKT